MQDFEVELVRPPILVRPGAKGRIGARIMHHRAFSGVFRVGSVHWDIPMVKKRAKTASIRGNIAQEFGDSLTGTIHQQKLYFLIIVISFSYEKSDFEAITLF
jgi:hypothetical protein